MADKSINKVIFGGETLIDLTGDTVDAAHLLTGQTAHDKSGAVITGTCDFDSNTNDATVAVSEILESKTAYARGAKLTGTMPNNGAVEGIISVKDTVYVIPQGFHDGSGNVKINTDEQAKIIPNNIREGITILGVEGTMSGSEDVTAQIVSVTPSLSSQTILPDTAQGYNFISQVNVAPISYTETENAAGGLTATIAQAS